MDILNGKTYAITGGNSGIGRATALELVRRGARVAILGRDPQTLAVAQHELGPTTLVAQGDVTRREDLERFFDLVAHQFDRLDGLFVNAGMAAFAPIDVVTEQQIASLLDVNFLGAVRTIQSALPLLHSGAAIVLNSSMYTTIGVPGSSIYTASKAALESLARSLSAELVGRGIRVNAISPGNIATPLYSRLGMSPAELAAASAAELEHVPVKRFGSADELARAVVFLLSPDSAYMLGETLVVDGGRSRL
jgi:NAD(P)-dependent dehydrogenase (short-subunit alcohol dehydrogenase family)